MIFIINLLSTNALLYLFAEFNNKQIVKGFTQNILEHFQRLVQLIIQSNKYNLWNGRRGKKIRRRRSEIRKFTRNRFRYGSEIHYELEVSAPCSLPIQ